MERATGRMVSRSRTVVATSLVAGLILAAVYAPGATASGTVTYNPLVATWVNGVSQAQLETTVRELSGEQAAIIGGSSYTIQTRASSSGMPIDKAEQYVFEKMQSYGLGSVTYQAFPGKGGSAPSGRNVIGQITGTTKPNEIVVVSAHLDNRPWDVLAYGADDDASGVSAMLYLARSFAGKSFARTIRFVAFGDEENAPWTSSAYGSGYYAAQAKAAGENIVAEIDADAIAYNTTGQIAYMVTRSGRKDLGGGDAAIATMWMDAVATYGITGITPLQQASGDNLSDHGSFWKNGYHAVMLIERDDVANPNWHTLNDRITTFNWPFYIAVTRSFVATAAHEAQIISTN